MNGNSSRCLSGAATHYFFNDTGAIRGNVEQKPAVWGRNRRARFLSPARPEPAHSAAIE
jgi:hypothetical protein